MLTIESPDAVTTHIREYEGIVRDEAVPSLVHELVTCAQREEGSETLEYWYLLARTYELLGYCARYTPWLAYHPRFYWRQAASYFHEAEFRAQEAGLEALGSFLSAKRLLREGMTFYLLDSKRGDTHLREALERFHVCEAEGQDSPFRQLCLLGCYLVKHELQERESLRELHPFLQFETSLRQMSTLESATYLEQVFAKAVHFETSIAELLEKYKSNGPPRDFEILADARLHGSKAKIFGSICEHLIRLQRKNVFEGQQVQHCGDRIEEAIRQTKKSLEHVASTCDRLGLQVRALHAHAALEKLTANIQFGECIKRFAAANASDLEVEAAVLDKTVHNRSTISGTSGADLEPGRISARLANTLRRNGLAISDSAIVFRHPRHWIIAEGGNRYLVRRESRQFTIGKLEQQEVIFDADEPAVFAEFSETVRKAVAAYRGVESRIHQALEKAATLYRRMAQDLESAAVSPDCGPDLDPLSTTMARIFAELEARRYPLLRLIGDRILYCWSLLEMFQVRSRNVRRGTLLTAQCQVSMPDPDNPDEVLQIGADPVFRMTIPFFFCGAKGVEELHDFQVLALKTVRATIAQQLKNLLSEYRYVDPDLESDEVKKLRARLHCHEYLAKAMESFTRLFIVPAPGEMADSEVQRNFKQVQECITRALAEQVAARPYVSPLVDVDALEGITEFMFGVSEVLRGMNCRQQGQAWEHWYEKSIGHLTEATGRIRNSKSAYLFPTEQVRDTYAKFVEARICTIKGFRARYRFLDERSLEAAEQAKNNFLEAQRISEMGLGDFRGATKAAARAALMAGEIARLRADSKEEGLSQQQWLRRATALFAASGDSAGFDVSWRGLSPTRRRVADSADLAEVPNRAGPSPAGPRVSPALGTAERNKIFVSYAHEDRPWLEKLTKTLQPFVEERPGVVWTDTEIQVGDDWLAEIERALSQTRVAVLMVSENFLSSKFIKSKELPSLLDAKNVTIAWVLVRPCLVEKTPIASYQAAHDPKKSLEELANEPGQPQKALVEICKEIMKLVDG